MLALGAALAGQLAISHGVPLAGCVLLSAGACLLASAALTPTPVTERDTASQSVPYVDAADRDHPGLVGGRWGLLALLLVTGVAAAFRLPLLGTLPPGLAADEARLGLDAVDLLAGRWSGSPWAGWPVFHMLTLGSVAALGQTLVALRLPAALGGIAFAPALFLLGRQLGGTRLGAIAALLGAAIFWHADLSRGVWGYAAWGVTSETLGLALLLHAGRHRRPVAAAAAGIAFGLALQVSWSALGALGVGIVLLLRRSPRQRGRMCLPDRSLLAPFLVYGAIAAGPVLIGVTTPDRQPLLTPPALIEAPAARTTVWQSVSRVFLMFNVAGDPSPLHNLRGEPQLDGVTAAIFVLGIGVAAARWHVGAGGVLIGWLVVTVTVAALTGHHPPPDSLAAIHAVTPVLLLAGVGLLAVSGSFERAAARGVGWRLDLTLALLAIIIGINAHALFVRRPADRATWAAYGSSETMAAHQINRVIASHTVYLADVWLDHPTIRFLARDLDSPRHLDPATTLPLRQDESFIYLAPGHQEVVTDDLERLYEDGEIDRFRSPLDESLIVLRTFRAPAKVVAGVRGVTLRVSSLDRTRTSRHTLPTFDLAWPIPGESARASSLELFTALTVDAPGPHRFRMDGPSDAILEVNGAPVGRPGEEIVTTLPGGVQRLRVLATVEAASQLRLLWAPPGSRELVPLPRDHLYREQRATNGLLALYRPGTDPDREPELPRVERHVQREGNLPALSQPYVLDLVGTVDAPKSGSYRFRVRGSGAVSMWLNDQPLALGSRSADESASLVLAEGDHRIRLRLVDEIGPTRLNLAWSPPGEEFVAIPTSRFNPPVGPIDALQASELTRDTRVAALGTPRIRWLASLDGEPRAVAVGQDGAVYVTNSSTRDTQRIEAGGASIAPLAGSAASLPADVEVGPDGAVWVLDALDAQLRRIDPGTGAVTLVGGGNLGLYRPRGFGFAPDGTILVADTGGSRVVRLAQDGTLLTSIGTEVGGPIRLRQPTDIAVGANGDLFVVNGEGGGVLHLSPDGAYLNHWAVLPGDTERGPHIVVGPDGSVWVSEPDGRRISRFTQDGVPAGVVDQLREGRLLRSPIGIAVGADGTLYVADGSLRAVLAIGFTR